MLWHCGRHQITHIARATLPQVSFNPNAKTAGRGGVWTSKPAADVLEPYMHGIPITAVLKRDLTNGSGELRTSCRVPTLIVCPGRGASMLQAEPFVWALVPHGIMVVSYDPPVSVCSAGDDAPDLQPQPALCAMALPCAYQGTLGGCLLLHCTAHRAGWWLA